MKTIHIHLTVRDLSKNIQFYQALFDAPPSVLKDDYAKWYIENPKVNLSLSTNTEASEGIEHLGIQVGSSKELQEFYQDIQNAKSTIRTEGKTTCCYAQSEKSWIADPQGIEWEIFHTFGESATYGKSDNSCCSTQGCC